MNVSLKQYRFLYISKNYAVFKHLNKYGRNTELAKKKPKLIYKGDLLYDEKTSV